MITNDMEIQEDRLLEKSHHLHDVFEKMESVLVALSGGIDSTLALKIAHETLGDRALGVTAVSPTFPQSELDDVRKIASEIGARWLTAETNQLDLPEFVKNDASRCFHCKTDLYTLLSKLKNEMGLATIVDGTNLDDLADDRPGMAAARALGVRSPFVESGMTKAEIRALARHLGLSNWNKPAAACLSSRIPRGIQITENNLRRVDRAEAVLRREGFTQIRVRDHSGIARIEIGTTEFQAILDTERCQRIIKELKALGYKFVTLDLGGYQQGGGN